MADFSCLNERSSVACFGFVVEWNGRINALIGLAPNKKAEYCGFARKTGLPHRDRSSLVIHMADDQRFLFCLTI